MTSQGGGVEVPNIRLVLEYDGIEFHGWQKQKGLTTVQGDLENALSLILREKVRLVGAGRTDAGCHALHQVANFLTESKVPIEKIQAGMNGLMHGRAVVKEITEAPPGFNARFSALSRKYRYLIATSETALWRNRAWVMSRELELDRMNEASTALVGRHDYSAFSRSGERTKKNPVCHVYRAGWMAWDLGLAFEIEADRFTHGMVRAMVGTLARVGTGDWPVERVREILEGRDRCAAGIAAPAFGLYLVDVKYLND
jgi:tRNA pseudouridine38-40 synthase